MVQEQKMIRVTGCAQLKVNTKGMAKEGFIVSKNEREVKFASRKLDGTLFKPLTQPQMTHIPEGYSANGGRESNSQLSVSLSLCLCLSHSLSHLLSMSGTFVPLYDSSILPSDKGSQRF